MAPKEPPKARQKAPQTGATKDRQVRLAEALRENLRRRKAQTRDRKDEPAGGDEPTS